MSDFAVGLLGNHKGVVKPSYAPGDIVFARIPDPKSDPPGKLKVIVVHNSAVPNVYGLQVVIRNSIVTGVYENRSKP